MCVCVCDRAHTLCLSLTMAVWFVSSNRESPTCDSLRGWLATCYVASPSQHAAWLRRYSWLYVWCVAMASLLYQYSLMWAICSCLWIFTILTNTKGTADLIEIAGHWRFRYPWRCMVCVCVCVCACVCMQRSICPSPIGPFVYLSWHYLSLSPTSISTPLAGRSHIIAMDLMNSYRMFSTVGFYRK